MKKFKAETRRTLLSACVGQVEEVCGGGFGEDADIGVSSRREVTAQEFHVRQAIQKPISFYASQKGKFVHVMEN